MEFRNCKIGEKDDNGLKIVNIFSSTEEYLVYEIETREVESIKIIVNGKGDKVDKIIKVSTEIRSKIIEALEAKRQVLDCSISNAAIAAIAISAILNDNSFDGKEKLDELIKKINLEKENKEKEQYKKEQKKRIEKYKVGEKDINGYTIKKVFNRGDEHVVYEIDTKDLVDSLKITIDTIEEDSKELINNYSAIRAKFTEVKGLLYKVVDKTSIKTIISHILVSGITGNASSANNQFDLLIEQINREYRDQFNNKMRFLISALLFTLFIIHISVLNYYYDCYQCVTRIRDLIFVATGGALGGFFSVSLGIKKLVCEKEVAKWIYIIYGLERIVIAIMASAIVYFAIQADLVFSVCKKLTCPLVGYVIFSIVAGFSETFIPSLLKKIERTK